MTQKNLGKTFHPCPKSPPRPKKPRKPLKRSRKKIQRKSKFHAQTNPFKAYHLNKSPEDVMAFAETCRARRLESPTECELAFAELLRQLGVGFEREVIIYYAGGFRFLILDFLITRNSTHSYAIEIDGGIHKRQIRYDRERDDYLASQGIRTIRFSNSAVLHRSAEVADKVREAIES